MGDTPSLTWLLTSIVLISMIAGVFGIWWSDLEGVYGTPEENKSLEAYNKLDEINNDMETFKYQSTNITEQEGSEDRLGNFFSNAYKSLTTIPKSLDMLFEFLNVALLEIPMGSSGVIISISLSTILIILIFVGIILAILLKFKT